MNNVFAILTRDSDVKCLSHSVSVCLCLWTHNWTLRASFSPTWSACVLITACNDKVVLCRADTLMNEPICLLCVTMTRRKKDKERKREREREGERACEEKKKKKREEEQGTRTGRENFRCVI